MKNIKPLPDKVGVGFQSIEQCFGTKHREEQHPHFWRYHVSPESWVWPLSPVDPQPLDFKPLVIDGFSPNLNKSLHVHHMRQLALANCLSRVIPSAHFVSLLGCEGILKKAQDELQEWFDFLGFHPTLYYDVLMPKDEDIVIRHEGEGQYAGAMVWDGPQGPVVVLRSPDENGYRRPTYSFHDLAFAKLVGPDYYITGAEQIEHFQRLGLDHKHLVMGLVVGTDNKKLKSRSGDGMLAKEALDEILAVMQPVPEPKKIAWNIIAWNMLATGRSQNVKFDAAAWVKPEAPGMYCSYTWARLNSALGSDQICCEMSYEMTQDDAELAGFSQYRVYHQMKAREGMDPAGLSNYLYDLCRRATKAYHTERIRDGRPGFRYAMSQCLKGIGDCMKTLGMFPVVMREEKEEITVL